MRALLLLVAVAPFAFAADAEPGAKLTGKLTVKDVQGGFAGFNGKVYTINTDGSYTIGNQVAGRVTEMGKGKLKADELAKLAKALKKYGADSLKTTGKPVANPHVVTVTYGKHSATLNLLTTAALPKPDEKDMGGRFSGVVNAVKEALPKPKAPGAGPAK